MQIGTKGFVLRINAFIVCIFEKVLKVYNLKLKLAQISHAAFALLHICARKNQYLLHKSSVFY